MIDTDLIDSLKDLPISQIRGKVNDDTMLHELLRQGDTLRAKYLRHKDELMPADKNVERIEKLRESGKVTEVAKIAQQLTVLKDELFESPDSQEVYDKITPLIDEFASYFD